MVAGLPLTCLPFGVLCLHASTQDPKCWDLLLQTEVVNLHWRAEVAAGAASARSMPVPHQAPHSLHPSDPLSRLFRSAPSGARTIRQLEESEQRSHCTRLTANHALPYMHMRGYIMQES